MNREIDELQAAAPAPYFARSRAAAAPRPLAEILIMLRCAAWNWQRDSGRVDWYGNAAEAMHMKGQGFSGLAADFMILLPEDSRRRFLSRLRQAIRSRAIRLRIDQHLNLPNGSNCWVEVGITLEYNKHGRVSEVFGTLRDAGMVGPVDPTISEDFVTEAERAACAPPQPSPSNHPPLSRPDPYKQLLSQFSHDTRGTVSGLAGLAELALSAEIMDERVRNRLIIIRKASCAMLSLLDSMVRYTGDPSYCAERHQPFQLKELLAQIDAFGSVGAAAKRLEWNVRVDANVPAVVVGARTDLERVLLNLVTNAIKFTEAGAVSLHVRRRGDTIHNQTVLLAFDVMDSGVGLDRERISGLFKPLSQDRTPGTQGEMGFGMGLAICKRLALQAGGDILVESQPGLGSTFTLEVSLPFVMEAATQV